MDGVFLLGTDTGVGKTSVSAGILKIIHGTHKVCYWKPVQNNTIVADDTSDIKTLTSLPDDCFVEPAYRFAEPLSPRMAAKKWGKSIDVEAMGKTFDEKVREGNFVVVEGAGGLLVPFSDTHLQVDFIKRLRIPVILVGSDKVGTINQALLSINYMREAKVPCLGVILTRSRAQFGNAENISHFGKTEILAELAPSEDVRNVVAQVGGNDRLRDLFRVASMPG
jgi:dethiobiotin synthase